MFRLGKKKLDNKYFLIAIQLIVMAVLFIFVFDKQAVFILRDLLDKFQFSTNIQNFIYEILIAFKVLVHSPSFFAMFIIFTQIIALSQNAKKFFELHEKPFKYIDGQIFEKEIILTGFEETKKYSYLKNLRLLFWDNLLFDHKVLKSTKVAIKKDK